MAARMKVIFLYSSFLLVRSFRNVKAEDASSNPCSDLPCPEGSLCWNDGGKGKCENACNSTYCGEDHDCVTEIGACGNSSCRPTGRCHDRMNHTFAVLCQNVTCPNDTKCTIVMPIFPTGPMPMAICGPNPCLEHECCGGDGAVDGFCEKDACYLRRAPAASINDIRLEPWCVNPCLLHDLHCAEPDEFCYTNRVKCFAPPCNPVPVCRKPCGANPEMICGRPGLKCEVIPANCLEDDDDLSFSFWGTCQPTERCIFESEI